MKFWLPSTKAYFFQSNVRCMWPHSASRIKLLLILLGLSLSVVTRNTCYLSILVRMYSRPWVQFFPNTDSYWLVNNIKFVGACFSGISNWSVFPQSLKRPFAKNWNKPYFLKKKCTIKLNANYMLQTANVSNQTRHSRSVVVFAVKCSKNDICVKIYYYIGNDCRELLSFKMGFGKRN